ncbi:MAG TPA: hypothetical protein VL053_05995 [Arachidicoccus sp.]|nr:hypothetical protein [Arachidicoccus sp.]
MKNKIEFLLPSVSPSPGSMNQKITSYPRFLRTWQSGPLHTPVSPVCIGFGGALFRFVRPDLETVASSTRNNPGRIVSCFGPSGLTARLHAPSSKCAPFTTLPFTAVLLASSGVAVSTSAASLATYYGCHSQ